MRLPTTSGDDQPAAGGFSVNGSSVRIECLHRLVMREVAIAQVGDPAQRQVRGIETIELGVEGDEVDPTVDHARGRAHAAEAMRVALVERDLPVEPAPDRARLQVDLEQRPADLSRDIARVRQADINEPVGYGGDREDRSPNIVKRVATSGSLPPLMASAVIALPEPTSPVCAGSPWNIHQPVGVVAIMHL